MKKNNDEKKLSLLFIGTFFIFAFFIIFSHKVKAASDQDYFPMYQNHNGLFNDTVINFLNTQYDSENNYIFCRTYGTLSGNRPAFTVTYFSKEQFGVRLYAEKNNNLYQFSLYKYGTGNVYQRYFYFNNGTCTEYQWTQSNWATDFSNLYSNNYRNTVDYVSNFNLLTNNTDTAQLVLIYQQPPEYDDEENDTFPNNAEKPDLTNYYNSDEAPLFDNSSTTSAIQSLYNILKWFFGNNGIGGIINYLIDSINWGLQKVINNIRQVLQNVSTELQEVIDDFSDVVSGFLSDIKDFVSDIKDKLADLYDGFMDFADLFINPFDEEEFDEQIENCQLISQYNELMENCEDLRAIFNNAVERDYFVLYIDFENPFADSEHKIIHSEISFTWLKDYRSIYRPFLWVFTMLECFIGGMRLLGGIIGGKAK